VSTAEQAVEPLVQGDKLSREEFLRRWEAMPEVKRAELIGGIVYMPSPVGPEHAWQDMSFSGWLWHYQGFTPGCDGGSNGTWLMLDDAPQPDSFLWILPECGGQGRRGELYLEGAPELAAEVSHSRTAYDLHQKKELYATAGVQEYVTLLVREKEVRWHRLVKGSYERMQPGADGILRSIVFPGLWLDAAAFLTGDTARVIEVLQQGIRSSEHADFVSRLAARKATS
jgi:Uma2 family endonuclease